MENRRPCTAFVCSATEEGGKGGEVVGKEKLIKCIIMTIPHSGCVRSRHQQIQGLAIAQVVNCHFNPRRPNSDPGHVGFVVDEVALG
jgi:hypothetical protein